METLKKELEQIYEFKAIWTDSTALNGRVIYFELKCNAGIFTVIKLEDCYRLRYAEKESGFSYKLDTKEELIERVGWFASKRKAEQLRLL